jgi:hypothetical protein
MNVPHLVTEFLEKLCTNALGMALKSTERVVSRCAVGLWVMTGRPYLPLTPAAINTLSQTENTI